MPVISNGPGTQFEYAECAGQAWSIAIFAARETLPDLLLTLEAALSAVSKPAVIDLLINGNETLAIAVSEHLASNSSGNGMSTVRVWSITLGDKAHAWNQYVHSIWPCGKVTFFMDGYVQPDRNALKLLDASLLASSQALGATGVPRIGRSAQYLRKVMIQQGGIHGNLFCLSQETIRRIRNVGFKLPLGIYRTDATLAAALMFNLDPAHNEWDSTRIQVQPDASWSTRKRDWWRFSDLKDQAKRIMRQTQGTLENRAVRQHMAISRRSPAELPDTVAELVFDWIKNNPLDAHEVAKGNMFYKYTLKKLGHSRNWQAADIPPQLMCTRNNY